MITRPMSPPPPLPELGHSDAALHPLQYNETLGPNGGYPAPIRRTKMFTFRPGALPPVNLVRGGPRLYG